MLHVRSHVVEHGNEHADALAKEGSKLRFDLVNLAAPDEWFTETLARYWGNRKPT